METDVQSSLRWTTPDAVAMLSQVCINEEEQERGVNGRKWEGGNGKMFKQI
jgi:hypothetical protein